MEVASSSSWTPTSRMWTCDSPNVLSIKKQVVISIYEGQAQHWNEANAKDRRSDLGPCVRILSLVLRHVGVCIVSVYKITRQTNNCIFSKNIFEDPRYAIETLEAAQVCVLRPQMRQSGRWDRRGYIPVPPCFNSPFVASQTLLLTITSTRRFTSPWIASNTGSLDTPQSVLHGTVPSSLSTSNPGTTLTENFDSNPMSKLSRDRQVSGSKSVRSTPSCYINPAFHLLKQMHCSAFSLHLSLWAKQERRRESDLFQVDDANSYDMAPCCVVAEHSCTSLFVVKYWSIYVTRERL